MKMNVADVAPNSPLFGRLDRYECSGAAEGHGKKKRDAP